MKFEEKRKKNKNCEISHIVRPVVTPKVYNQRQNSLSISECVEHRMFKVAWARLCVDSVVCTAECTFQTYARPSASSDARTTECAARRFVAHVSHECTAKCMFRTYPRPSARSRTGVRLGCWWCTTSSGPCAHGHVHSSVATHGLVVHGLNFYLRLYTLFT